MDYFIDILVLYQDYALTVFCYIVLPETRVFWLYLVSSTVIAFLIYALTCDHSSGGGHDAEAERRSFLAFLFPKHVWSHPSAWLDLRYFFFNRLTGHFLLIGLMAGGQAWGYALMTGGENIAQVARLGDAQMQSQFVQFSIAFGYMFIFFVVGDFLGFLIHYLQHKIPVLWEFHKVHHSAEVMHPLTNFREHPIDNLAYFTVIGLGYGLFMGFIARFFGFLPSMPTVLGVPILMFFFNFIGYNLRHSHIWVRWPGIWSKLFPSPAHHHVHHSCHPDHLDKNFAFIFPVWDVIFGTYEMPKNNKDVKFGVLEIKDGEMDSCIKLYVTPFQKVYRIISGKAVKRDKEAQPRRI